MGKEEQARSCMCPHSRQTHGCDRAPGSVGERGSGRVALESSGEERGGFPWDTKGRALFQLILVI